MSSFGGIYITRLGQNLQSKTIEGKLLKLVSVQIGTGKITGDLEKVEHLVNMREEIDINDFRISDDKKAIITFVFNNYSEYEGYYWREIGVMAEDPDTGEKILYAYANAGDEAEYIPNSEKDIINKKVDIILSFENIENVVIEINDNMYITRDEYDKKISEITFNDYIIHNNEDIIKNTNYDLPYTYIVGENNLEIYVEGIRLIKDENFIEVGEKGEESNTIQFKDWNVNAAYVILARIKGKSIKIYTKDEAIEAVKLLWSNEYTFNVVGLDVDRNYRISVSKDTVVKAYYLVNRYTLEVTQI